MQANFRGKLSLQIRGISVYQILPGNSSIHHFLLRPGPAIDRSAATLDAKGVPDQ